MAGSVIKTSKPKRKFFPGIVKVFDFPTRHQNVFSDWSFLSSRLQVITRTSSVSLFSNTGTG
jgi:hypothetical protein